MGFIQREKCATQVSRVGFEQMQFRTNDIPAIVDTQGPVLVNVPFEQQLWCEPPMLAVSQSRYAARASVSSPPEEQLSPGSATHIDANVQHQFWVLQL